MCEAKEDQMKKYLSRVKQLVKKFKEASFVQLPKEENMEAECFGKSSFSRGAIDEYDKVQHMPSIDLLEIQQVEGEENWMTPIVIYLKDGKLLETRMRIED